MTDKISRFNNRYFFLSNFHPVRITVENVEYSSVEHAYQASKTLSLPDRIIISKLPTSGQAKRYGRSVSIRPGWDKLKVDVMLSLLRQKFSNSTLRAMLLNTGEAELIEENWWGDNFWGVYDGYGENMLGKLLMKVRGEIKEGG